MSIADVHYLILAILALLTATTGFSTAWLNRKSAQQGHALSRVEVQLNGRMSALLARLAAVEAALSQKEPPHAPDH